jgi:hypothetical protein
MPGVKEGHDSQAQRNAPSTQALIPLRPSGQAHDWPSTQGPPGPVVVTLVPVELLELAPLLPPLLGPCELGGSSDPQAAKSEKADARSKTNRPNREPSIWTSILEMPSPAVKSDRLTPPAVAMRRFGAERGEGVRRLTQA